MLEDYDQGNNAAKPDSKIFAAVIHAWTGWPEVRGAKQMSDPDLAVAMLRRMSDYKSVGVYPSAFTYTRVIICLKKSCMPQRAEDLLFEMDHHYKRGVLDQGPNLQAFQTVLNAWKSVQSNDKFSHIQKLQNEVNKRFKNFDDVPRGGRFR